MKPKPHSRLRTNLRCRWQPSGEVAEEEAGEAEVEEIGEVEVSQISPDPPQAASPINPKTKTKVKVKVRVSLEAPDTHQTLQSPAAAATIDTVRKLGSVLHPSPVHGSTSVRLGHEGPTSLEQRK